MTFILLIEIRKVYLVLKYKLLLTTKKIWDYIKNKYTFGCGIQKIVLSK